jgi:class 3 adenylate cyclase
MVFDDVRDAGIVALRLCERLEEARADGRLSIDIRLRVALHAGPVLRCHNAVTKREDVIGVHVNRAARLEPSTPTGHVYATEPFVALAYAEHVKEFRCDYVGPTRLAKDFGTEPAYHVRWVGRHPHDRVPRV